MKCTHNQHVFKTCRNIIGKSTHSRNMSIQSTYHYYHVDLWVTNRHIKLKVDEERWRDR